MRRAARVDVNHPEIVDALRKAGASVLSLASLGEGCPDLLVAHHRAGTFLVEVKRPLGPQGGESRSSLNQLQRDFLAAWRGRIELVRSPEDAVRLLGYPHRRHHAAP
jgi:hypothetical protein